MDCALCRVKSSNASQFILEEQGAFAMLSHEPLKDPHVMVLPSRCVSDLGLLKADEAQAWTKLCDRVMRALDEHLDETPMLLVNGYSFRTQPQHLHAHILPSRFPLRGLYEIAENVPGRERKSEDVLAAMAERVRTMLEK